MNDMTPLLEIKDVSKRFEYVEALKSVNLTIGRREVVALVGDNGAGKSTLVKIIAGLCQPTSGGLVVRGEPVRIGDVRDANALGIVSVFQGNELCENLNVAANLFLGRELRTGCGIRDENAMVVRARAVLDTLSSSIQVGRPVASLSVGQRRIIAIAKTLLSEPDLVVLDEPTDSLSVMQTAEVLEYIRRLRAEGRSVIMVCHDLPDVFAVADRIAVLRQGRIIAVHETCETSYEQTLAEMAGIVDEDADGRGDESDGVPAGGAIGYRMRVGTSRRLIERRGEQSGLPV